MEIIDLTKDDYNGKRDGDGGDDGNGDNRKSVLRRSSARQRLAPYNFRPRTTVINYRG